MPYLLPMQLRTPKLNGKNAAGCRLRTFSGRKWSGLNASADGPQMAVLRCSGKMGMIRLRPAGKRKLSVYIEQTTHTFIISKYWINCHQRELTNLHIVFNCSCHERHRCVESHCFHNYIIRVFQLSEVGWGHIAVLIWKYCSQLVEHFLLAVRMHCQH